MIAARRIELTAVGMSRRLAGKSCLELLIETEFHICSWRRSIADLRHNRSQTSRAGSPDLAPPEKSSSAALKEMRHSSISFVTTGRYERQLSNRFPCSVRFRRTGIWITGWTSRPGNEHRDGRRFRWPAGRRCCSEIRSDGTGRPVKNRARFPVSPLAKAEAYVIPLAAGEAFPAMPAEGFRSEREVSALPGARKIDAAAVPGPSSDVYAFYRRTTQRISTESPYDSGDPKFFEFSRPVFSATSGPTFNFQ